MSDYTSLAAVSLALQKLLEGEITDSTDPQLGGVKVYLDSPKRMKDENQNGISLWLYRVTREGDTLNRPPERIAPNRLRAYPVPLTLFFLVTPMLGEPRDEQAVLGKVVQVLNDHGIVRGAQVGPVLGADGTELHIALDGLTLEELARVWDVLKEPYQLSVCYVVQTVTIDSDLDVVVRPPVLTGDERVHQIVGRTTA